MSAADESPTHRTATVVIPTHDHGPTLRWSVASALAQTIQDIEVFIIGDGVPDNARAVIDEIVSSDSRVRYFDHPKAPRNGEILRHETLRYARGEFVAYLSDDDLWFPSHLETMQQLLWTADLASTLPFYRSPDGSLDLTNVDLAIPYYRQLTLSGENRVPLSCGAHTLVAYRRLPEGWRTTPPGKATDLHMWQQFLENPMCRAATGITPTVLVFPSPLRPSWSVKERAAELELAWNQMQSPFFGEEFLREVVAADARERTRLEVHCSFVQSALAESRNASERLEEARQQASKEGEELRQGFHELEDFHQQKVVALEGSLVNAQKAVQDALTESQRVSDRMEEVRQQAANETEQLRRRLLELEGLHEKTVAALEASLKREQEAVSSLQAEKDVAARELHALQHTSTWRLRERILERALLAPLAVRLAKILAGRSPD